jgi:hypothetical protein
MDKAEVARRQLGTALDMFLREQDPVSVHSLAMAGGEVAEGLARNAGVEPFVSHVLKTFPDMDMPKIRNIQRKYSNAFKHAMTRNGQDRQDTEIIKSFDPKINEDTLFVGWHDMLHTGLPAPIEAQAFMVWYFAKNPEKLNPAVDISTYMETFPNLRSLSPRRQLDRLRDVIRKAKKNSAAMQDPGTDRRRLVLSWGIGPR